ncbi:MAG: YhgE/Pip family protein, partial [Anaerovoracaceae bacterium]|nr:YhgE/Pip family protein [Anaerovoracaceae bacterium]
LGQLKTGLGDSKTPGETVMYGSAQIKNGLSQLQGNSSALNEGASKLDTGLGTLSSNNDKLNSGASQLAEGSKSLESGVSKYTAGVGTAQKGAGQLADGTSQLQGKLPVLASGVNQLDNGGKQLADGAGTLNEGTGKLKAGIGTASDGVSTAIGKANTEVKKLDGLAEYAKEPVKTKTEYVQPVANYGSAFAPYFMGLSLWVGGLLIFFGLYFDYSRRIKMLSQESTRVIARALAFGAVSVGQGILLAFVIKSVLHIAVRNPFALYWSSILVAMTFTAIIMFCIINLKDIGKFIVMLLLILQLTSCAGTFPIETQNAFFRAINPFLPMTYSTQLFKEAISGTMGTNAANSALIVLSFFAGFMALTMILSHKKIKKDIKHIAQDAKAHAA